MNAVASTTAYLVRHGRTTLNAAGVLRGHVNIPLDAVGQVEAARLGELFAPVRLAAVISSPLRRALQTAAPLAAAVGVVTQVDQAFVDRDYGQWSGVSVDELVARFGALGAAPGVEPVAAFERRVRDRWEAVAAELKGEAIAEGWFGPRVLDRVRPWIGDVVAAARGPVGVFQREVDPGQARLVGHHGSVTAAERLVPLILVRRL
jgi:broad specificity phosphatase PhoE